MTQTLLSGMLLSPTQELKNLFSEKRPFLPKGWINVYLDRFCNDLVPSDIAKLTKHLYHLNDINSLQAPKLSVLNNVDILIAENNWTAEQS